MTTSSQTKTAETDPAKCLARSVTEVLAQEPTVEAVTLNRSRKTVSVATLGQVDVPKIQERISATIQSAETEGGMTCGLLSGREDCSDCATPLTPAERRAITIRNEGDSMTIARVTCPTAPTFWRWRDFPWPRVVQRDVEFLEHAEEVDEWKLQMAAAVLCGGCALAAHLLDGTAAQIYLYLAAYLAGSWFTAQEVWERLRHRAVDVHFLMLAVAAGSASIGAWGEGATLLFLFSLSGALEHFALGRTHREIRALFKEAPKSATVLNEKGVERETPVELLRPGMRLLIKPGAQFPADAELVKGRTASDESNLTGEAAPVEKAVGDTVLAGTLNLWGAVEVSVLRPARDSALQKIIQLIREAQQRKAPAQRFTDKFGTVYTYIILTLSLVMFLIWWKVSDLPPFTGVPGKQSAFYHAMTLLVVASPCALVLSIPSAVLAAIAWGARHGILFRGGAAVEKLAGINTVALDKTGTLTTGELRVERVESFPPGRQTEVARLAFSLEKLSTHPLARAVTRYGKQQGLEPVEFGEFASITGYGLEGTRDGRTCRLGRREWVAEGARVDAIEQVPPTEAGFAEVWVREGDLLGRIVLRDDVRAEAKALMEELGREGLRTVVLTGDREGAAAQLKADLGLTDVRAGLRPEQKVEAIEALSKGGGRVAMIGDGVNDAPSLAAADVGVAMGARGSDAALEQAEVVLMHDRLENFLAAFRLSQRARRVIRLNLVISLGTVAVLVTLALLGIIPLTVGVVGHEGSTVVVVMNSLRLLFGGAAARPAGAR
jgi:Zn2+/Cd2+-exporting ATPase